MNNKAIVTAEPGEKSFTITRTFDAPRELVFDVWSKPELVKRWWGAKRVTMTVCEIDLRVGGTYRYVGITPDGMEIPFTGTYSEIDRPKRLVCTEIFDIEPYKEFPALLTTNFLEAEGVTTIHILVEHQSVEFRDGHLNSGMEDGMNEGMVVIDALLEELKQGA